MENCILCLTSTHCTSCEMGYYLESDFSGCIDECNNDDGYYVKLDSELMQCGLCGNAINNCAKCEYDSECLECEDSYALNAKKQCVVDCGEGYWVLTEPVN